MTQRPQVSPRQAGPGRPRHAPGMPQAGPRQTQAGPRQAQAGPGQAPCVPRAAVVAAARAYLNVRWQHQGRTHTGIDCVGLLICVAHNLRISQFDMTGYGRVPVGSTLRSVMDTHLDSTTDYIPGNLVLMQFKLSPMHVGILTDRGLIHAYAGARRVVEHGIDDHWRHSMVCAYSYRGVY